MIGIDKKEEIVRLYFKSWIDNDSSIIEEYFCKDILYVESWGPAYNGLAEVRLWFQNWHVNGEVLIWEVKECVVLDEQIICEWYFKYKRCEDINEINGVSLIYFNNDNKISKVKEFMSVLPRRHPYGKNGGISDEN